MSISSILSLLDSVGITKQAIDVAVEEAAKSAVIEKTKQVQAYWKSIAPVGENVRAHAIIKGSSHIIESGTYRDSIKLKFTKEKGKTVGIVYSTEPQLARWIEYGTYRMAAQGIAQRVVDNFGGTEMA